MNSVYVYVFCFRLLNSEVMPKENCKKRRRHRRRLQQQNQQHDKENNTLRRLGQLSQGLSAQSARLDHLESLVSINGQQWLTHDNQINELYELDRQSRTIRDKTNEALGFIIHGCCLLQEEIKKQQQQYEQQLQQLFSVNSQQLDENN